MANKCKECGCSFKHCLSTDHDVHLHVEIENLQQKLVERENHIVTMETNFLNEANKFPSGELVALREELLTWQDKYRRLYDAHRRIQRVNQGLEDKLLKLVDVCETDKNTLTKDVAILSKKLAEANYTIKKLSQDNERYKKDVSLAIKFLQCKQTNFVSHKFDDLSQEVQGQVSSFMTDKPKPEEKKITYEMKSIKVPIPTFPPTAMFYSVSKSPNLPRKAEDDEELPAVDVVSAAIMAKVLEERQKDRAYAKHCDTCTCSKKLNIIYNVTHHTIGTQTEQPPHLRPTPNSLVNINSQSQVKIMKPDSITKKAQIYPNNNDATEIAQSAAINVVKVQPNNFLIDIGSADAEPLDNTVPNVAFFNVNETSQSQIESSNVKPLLHHRLCSNNHATKSDSEVQSAKNSSSERENPKGPRYCSMRLQTGSRNILLDNAHNSVAPVLYTRHHKTGKREDTPKTHDASRTPSSSSEDVKMSVVTSSEDNSTKNQQRVADWIQSNLDQEVSSSENSQSEPLIARPSGGNPVSGSGAEKHKYAEMEEHVKRFLFGESDFLKTVEIGKLKYHSFNETEAACQSTIGSNSHTETKI